jgi:hypothetical protein
MVRRSVTMMVDRDFHKYIEQEKKRWMKKMGMKSFPTTKFTKYLVLNKFRLGGRKNVKRKKR